jgi:hypothetical protein
MRVFCLYRPNTDHERSVIELDREVTRRLHRTLEIISVESVEGERLARTYDIMAYPAVVVVDSNGGLQASWCDGNLPLINELSYYLEQV